MLEDALEHLVRGIVDHDDDVSVEMTTGRRGRTLQIRVHPDDLGKVIGRGGRTATASPSVSSTVSARVNSASMATAPEVAVTSVPGTKQ